MSLAALLDRRVTIVAVTAGTKDRYGNQALIAETGSDDVPTRRDQVDAAEDRSDRDQQRQTFTYWFLPDVPIRGRDRIIDAGDTLEVIGEPNQVHGQRGVHHLEVRAQRVDG